MDQPFKILYIGSELETITDLERNDYFEVHNEPNGLKAFEWMTNGEFRAFDPSSKLNCYKNIEAIVCETNLPGLNGLGLYQEMQKKNLKNGFIFFLVAANPNDSLKKKSLELGINGFLTKPVNSKLVYDRIIYLKNSRPVKKQFNNFSEDRYRTPLSKRLFDIVVASVALVLLSPVMIFIAIAIWLEDKGPAIYKSKRVGANFDVFDFYKFRSMYKDADKRLKEWKESKKVYDLNQYEESELLSYPENASVPDGELISKDHLYHDDGKPISEKLIIKQNEARKAFLKIQNDPRVTRMGRFIRNTSLDELPQLFNVLKGDMSIVGNRPLPVYEAHALTKWARSRRFYAAAGLTGLWQVELRGQGGFMSEKKRYMLDNRYARRNSFWGDIKILIRTLPVMFQKTDV